MQELKQQIKQNEFKNLYLFYGQETYILNTYLNIVVEKLTEGSNAMMNLDMFETKTLNLDHVVDAMETLPFLGEKRVVVMKDFDFTGLKDSEKIDKFLIALDKIPETTVLIIVETKIDKRSKLYKKVTKIGQCVEFKILSEEDLIKHIANELHKSKLKIERKVAIHFISTVGSDLTTVHHELEKLISFNKNKTIVELETIDQVCTKSIESKIFELVDCMGSSKRQYALKLYHDMITLKEPPARILFMITRQFRLVLQIKTLLAERVDRSTIASRLGVAPFLIDKLGRQGSKFSSAELKEALKDCLEVEVEVKNGRMNRVLGIELLIVKWS